MDSIRVGFRFRRDLGDLDELCASIEKVGLLQPITITPDGTLVCGRRRLAAVQRLRWSRIKVWVNSSISTRLAEILAEQHENTTRKALTPTEAARLYAELKRIYSADAADRQQATRFSADHNPRRRGGGDGDADSASPSDAVAASRAGLGAVRRQAARAITGRDSSWSLEHVNEVQRIADDPATSQRLRELAVRELAAMDADGKINGHHLTVQAAVSTERLTQLADDASQPVAVREQAARELTMLDHSQPSGELVKAARAAIARATGSPSTEEPDDDRGAGRPRLVAVKRWGVRAFLSTVDEMDRWWEHYDADELAAGLTETQWQRVQAGLDGSTAFIQAIAAARESAHHTPPAAGF